LLDSVSLQLLLCVDIVVTEALLLMSVASILVSVANILVLAVSNVVVLGIVTRDLVSMTDIGVHGGMTLCLVLLTILQESLDVLNIVLVELWCWSISVESVGGGDNDINITTKTVTLVGTETGEVKRVDSDLHVKTIVIDFTLEVSVDLDESGSVVHLVRKGRLGMREWDVVTTVIITSEDGLVGRSRRMRSMLMNIERLLNVTVMLGDWKSFVLRLSEDNLVITSAFTVGSNMEEVHNLRVNDRELRLNQRLIMTTMIVVNEKNHVVHLHILGESRVNKEDWGLEDLVVGVLWLHIVATLEERLDLRLKSKDGVLNSSLSSANSFWNKSITF